MDDSTINRMRASVLAAARTSDRLRRRRHRVVAVAAAVGIAALVTAGAVVLTAPPPPTPLSSAHEYEVYESRIEAQWESILEDFPGAARPDVAFERFITDDEYDAVTLSCLREQGAQAEIDEHGVTLRTPAGSEEEHRMAWFACDVQFPLSPNESLAFTEDELRYIYRYFVDLLSPCLEAEGYGITPAPAYPEFRARWWTDDTWGPYRDVVETDAETFQALEVSCPPMPPDLRP